MSLYEEFETDKDLETKGIVMTYGGTTRVTISRAGGANKKFKKVMERLARPHKREIHNEMLSIDKQKELLAEAVAMTIIMRWETLVVVVDDEDESAEEKEVWREGIEAKDGKLIPWNKENLLETFKNLPDLLDDIAEDSGKAANYRQAIRDTDSENS